MSEQISKLKVWPEKTEKKEITPAMAVQAAGMKDLLSFSVAQQTRLHKFTRSQRASEFYEDIVPWMPFKK